MVFTTPGNHCLGYMTFVQLYKYSIVIQGFENTIHLHVHVGWVQSLAQ